MAENYSLLIAALVAVVAIVGLVLFAGGNSGMVVFESSLDTPMILGSQATTTGQEFHYLMGKNEAGPQCSGQDWTQSTGSGANRCCGDACMQLCEGIASDKVSGRTITDCFENCNSGCGVHMDTAYSTSAPKAN